jgi:hypothetical protein
MDLRLKFDNSRKETNLFNNLPFYLLCLRVTLLPWFSRGSNILLSYTAWYSLGVHIEKAITANNKDNWERISVRRSYHQLPAPLPPKKNRKDGQYPLPMLEVIQSGQLTTTSFSPCGPLSPMPMPKVAISYTYPTFLVKSHHPKGTTS